MIYIFEKVTLLQFKNRAGELIIYRDHIGFCAIPENTVIFVENHCAYRMSIVTISCCLNSVIGWIVIIFHNFDWVPISVISDTT